MAGSGPLETLATEINAEHRKFEQAARSALEHAYRTGELLNEAKAKLRHGEWLPWLEANCEVSDRQARTYMRVARGLPKSEVTSDMTLEGALREVDAAELHARRERVEKLTPIESSREIGAPSRSHRWEEVAANADLFKKYRGDRRGALTLVEGENKGEGATEATPRGRDKELCPTCRQWVSGGLTPKSRMKRLFPEWQIAKALAAHGHGDLASELEARRLREGDSN